MKFDLFDEKCVDLALHFLSEEPNEARRRYLAHDLALDIQHAVEDWFAQRKTGTEP